MDFVQAKSILDKFAQAYKAAEYMSEALETAVSLERRGMELAANVRHLEAEQQAQTVSLAAMEAEAAQTLAGLQQAQQQKITQWRAEADRVQAGLAAERARVEGELAEARQRVQDYSQRATATLAHLDRQIAQKQEELAAREAQIEALRAQARQVLT